MRPSRSISLTLAAAAVVSACGGGPAAPSVSDDPALAALRTCIAEAPDELCARPAVMADSSAALADLDYWTALRARDRGAFDAAVETCGRAGASGSAVGTMAGVTAARRRFAREQIAGRVPEGASLDYGVCFDIYNAFALDLAGAGQVGTASGDLTGPEAAFVATQARAARDRAGLDAMGGRAYDETSVGSGFGSPSEASPDAAP